MGQMMGSFACQVAEEALSKAPRGFVILQNYKLHSA